MSEIIKKLAHLTEQEQKLAIERALAFEKAFKSKDADVILKAQNMYNNFMQRQKPRSDGMKSMVLDPFEVNSSMGYYGKNAMISYQSLRAMSRAPIPRACINTRKDQVAEFCKPQSDKYSKGFTFIKKGVEDLEDLSDEDKRKIDTLTEFLLNCGDENNKWDLDDFETFVRKIIEDSLTYDQVNAEIIPNRKYSLYKNFEPTQIVAVDASTFRIAASYDNDTNIEGKVKVNGYYPSYVQLDRNNQICAEFYPWELMWGIRNPSTNIRQNNYGRSELEDMITIVTAMLNADKYNGNFFSRGASPKGMLLVKKSQGMNKDRLSEFRRDWNAQISGVENSWKTPVLDAEHFEWLDLQKSNRDMEFSKFQEYLVKLCCALYRISPEEIGFPLEGAGANKLNSDSGKAEKEYSISKGLKPLLTFIQNLINKYIIGPKTNYQYEFKFVGLEAESAEQEEERLQKAVTLYLTPDEVRKDKGLKSLPNGMGKLPLNPMFMQMKQMESQNAMEQKGKQEEQENSDMTNSNPFLDSEEENPFAKSFDNWCKRELFVA